MKHYSPLVLLGFVSCFCLTEAFQSEEARAGIDYRFKTFLSTGVATSDSEVPYGALQINDHVDPLRVTRVGFNLSTNITDKWQASVQALALGTDNELDLSLDWALLRWLPLNGLSVSVGKQKTPLWLLSEYIDVGLLYPWVRPPDEVYRLNSVNTFTGGSVEYQHSLDGGWTFDLQGFYGFGRLRPIATSSPITGEMPNSLGGQVSVFCESFILRASYAQTTVSLTAPTTIYAPTPLPGTSSANTLVTTYDLGTVRFASIGAELNNSQFWGLSEAAMLFSGDPNLGNYTAAYAGLGYWIQKNRILPHLTISSILRGNSILLGGQDKSATAGLNYWFSDSVVLKNQYQRVWLADSTQINLYWISLDVIF